jgi:hypothetical protein
LHGANETPQLELCPWGYLRGEALGTRGASDMKTSALTRAWLRSLALLATSGVVAAQPTEMERMQQQLNQQVMDAPFSVEDQARIDAYVKNAMQKDLKPVQRPPSYWRPGYTCDSIRGWGWRPYADCSYYHRYYGRYWY